ncbi:hypothetical protein MRX96_004324 [Rhipicephalus microplus]
MLREQLENFRLFGGADRSRDPLAQPTISNGSVKATYQIIAVGCRHFPALRSLRKAAAAPVPTSGNDERVCSNCFAQCETDVRKQAAEMHSSVSSKTMKRRQ